MAGLNGAMRRSIDDYPFDPADYPDHYEDDELTPISWGVAISDDYDDADPRVVLTVEEVGRAGYGLVGPPQRGRGPAAARGHPRRAGRGRRGPRALTRPSDEPVP